MKSNIDAVLAAAIIAFGFVFIHPFEDENGRIHRYLIHHLLARKQFSQQGLIFTVSASILDHISDYSSVLEPYSRPLLDFVDLEDEYEMPDKAVALLVRFLEQNNCKLSKRAKENEFADLTENEIKIIEENFSQTMTPLLPAGPANLQPR